MVVDLQMRRTDSLFFLLQDSLHYKSGHETPFVRKKKPSSKFVNIYYNNQHQVKLHTACNTSILYFGDTNVLTLRSGHNWSHGN